MKFSTIFTIAIMSIMTTIAHAQCDIPTIDGRYNEIQVVELEAPKEKIYGAALLSISKIFKDSDKVIQHKDKEDGVIMLSYNTHSSHKGMGPKNHYFKWSIQLEFKDNRYRITSEYLGHEAIWSSASIDFRCENDITSDRCGQKALIGKKEWNKHRCIAYQDHQSITKRIIESIERSVTTREW